MFLGSAKTNSVGAGATGTSCYPGSGSLVIAPQCRTRADLAYFALSHFGLTGV